VSPARRLQPVTALAFRGSPAAPGIGMARDARPPAWLTVEGKREWSRILSQVSATSPLWLREVDRAALAAYCSTWATFVAAQREVKRLGVLVPARSPSDAGRATGAVVKNPAVQIARDSAAALCRWCRELGFTPDARGRAALGAVHELDDDDPFDPFD
jgi:P27 family predicted phage terminase small subunit